MRTQPIPAVSVVIPLFDKEHEIGRALTSVRGQSCQDYEVIVVDDESTDGGRAVVEAAAAADPRIRLVSQPHAGVSVARNRGIEAARADLVAFLDADDEWLPDFLETVLQLRTRFPACEVFATSYFYQPPGQVRHRAILRGLARHDEPFVFDDYFGVASRSDPPLWSSALMATKRALTSVGGFPPSVTSGEDLLTWARMLARFECAYCPDPKAVFHLREPMRGAPARSYEGDDHVGRELARLASTPQGRAQGGMRRYVGMWHKMRASVYLRTGQRRDAVKEVFRALRYSPGMWQLYAYLPLAALPLRVRTALFRMSWGSLNRRRRAPSG
jgi:hypothetical protein